MCKGLERLPTTCLKSAKDIKSKIKVFLQKPEVQAASQGGKNAAAATAGTGSPSAVEVEKWKESFSHLMSSESGRHVFSSFLKSEFSQENMDFWIACEDYKKTAASKQGGKAKEIYLQYVDIDAPNEVNLDAVTREDTRQNVGNPHQGCFDDAQKMIYRLMEKDSYRRFLKSQLFEDLCQKHSDKAMRATCDGA